MIGLIEFFDAGFLRLVWALLVDYLVSSGYLLPDQRQLWVEGYVHIVGAAGAILFVGIWMHHSNKKETLKDLNQMVAKTKTGILGGFTTALKGFIFKQTTPATESATASEPTTQEQQP